MNQWGKLLEDSIETSKQQKKESRELEIIAMENSDKVSDDLIEDILEQEREYRKWLDEEIERERKELMKMK